MERKYQGIVCPEAGLAAVIVSCGNQAAKIMSDKLDKTGKF